jgi:nicotinamide riboside kinase
MQKKKLGGGPFVIIILLSTRFKWIEDEGRTVRDSEDFSSQGL